MKSSIFLLAAISHVAESANLASYQVDAYGQTFSATTTIVQRQNGSRPMRLRGLIEENMPSKFTDTTTQAPLMKKHPKSSPHDPISTFGPASSSPSTSSSPHSTSPSATNPNTDSASKIHSDLDHATMGLSSSFANTLSTGADFTLSIVATTVFFLLY